MKNTLLVSSLALALTLPLVACQPAADTTGEGSSSAAMMDDSDTDAMEQSSAMMMDDSSDAMMQESSATASQAETHVIDMTVESFKFTPNMLTVKKGEKVVIRLTAMDGTHSFMMNDLGINVPIKAGETKEIEIPTDTSGSFSFRCGVPCGEGHMDMKGTIIVQ